MPVLQTQLLFHRAFQHDRRSFLRICVGDCGRRGQNDGWPWPRPGQSLIPLAKNHLSRRGLQDRGDRNVDGLTNHFARVVDNHHSAVIQIGNALVVFLAFFQYEHLHNLARQHDRLQGICQFVDVQHRDTLQLRYFIEIEIVGDDLAFVELSQFNQFQIDFADCGKIIFHDLNLYRSDLLQALQNVEAAASTIAFERIGRIGYQLQFTQNELRRHDYAIEKAGLGDVGNAAINNYAGIQNFETLPGLFLPAENPASSREIEQVALVGPDNQPDVRHQEHDHDLQEALGISGRNAVANHQGKQVGTE